MVAASVAASVTTNAVRKRRFRSSRGDVIGPHLALLSQFFVGYRVTFLGSLIGFANAFAGGYVAGYAVVNDVSERHFQMGPGGQWDRGKGCDTFGPVGPWLVTTDEITDPQDLDLWLDVNGEPRQRGNTRTMVFGCANLVSYVSQFMTLLPGDIITTGTPPGVGMGIKPAPVFLKPGDVLTLGIQGLGEQKQRIAAYRG